VSISLLLVSKSDFLVSISLLLVSKSDFLVADELARFPTIPRNYTWATVDGARVRTGCFGVSAAALGCEFWQPSKIPS